MATKKKTKNKSKSKSGQVPEGDVRLVANIRKDLHKKLKHAAVDKEITLGEILEQLIEKNIKG